jgi:hypothetical protein
VKLAEINIDGADVPDPGSKFFYGANRWGSGIEIPAHDQDFYALKNVPHGQFFCQPDVVRLRHRQSRDRFLLLPDTRQPRQRVRRLRGVARGAGRDGNGRRYAD